MKMKVQRDTFGTAATIGKLSIDGIPYCDTLEDVDRDLEKDPSAKIPGSTAIPRGTYHVIMSFSPHFNRDMPMLFDVPGFDGVRIHPGNSDKDTEGCILVGVAGHMDDWISASRSTFEPLAGMIEQAIATGEEVTIEVV